MVETAHLQLLADVVTGALNEATIFRWWKRRWSGHQGGGQFRPSMKPPSFDGGNLPRPTLHHRHLDLPSMKPPSFDGGNVLALHLAISRWAGPQ